MPTDAFVAQLLAADDAATQRALLEARPDLVNDRLADALKAQADAFLRCDLRRCQEMAALLQWLPEVSGNPCHRALGLLVEANARSLGGLGEYQRAVELYDGAAGIFRESGLPAEVARSQLGRIWSLACLGRYDEAFEAGEWASRVLEEHGRWQQLGTLTMNLAAIRGRLGDDGAALAMLDRARSIYLKLGAEGEGALPAVDLNRSIVLRNLGRLDESMAASASVIGLLESAGEVVEAARARQNLAVTTFVLGRYNEALALLDQARAVLAADGRRRDVALLDLFAGDCLLQLRRYSDVLARCRSARRQFSELGARFEGAHAVLNEAAAHAGLGRFGEALASLDDARALFAEEPNPVWVAFADLERAALLLRQGQAEESLALAGSCADTFAQRRLPVPEAEACLAAARAQAGLGRLDAVGPLVDRTLALTADRDLPFLHYRCRHLQGLAAQADGDGEAALAHLDAAITALERLRGRLMIEHRADFAGDKEQLYEDAVGLCLDMDRVELALEYAERARSRALIDLISFQVELDVLPRSEEDRPLTDRLAQLRSDRDRLHRRWLAVDRLEPRGASPGEAGNGVDRQVLEIERQITELWHQLLVRHAGYADDAALCQVRAEPFRPLLPDDTVLLEWFFVHDRLVLFVAARDRLESRRLDVDRAGINRLLALLRLNLQSVSRCPDQQLPALATNARKLLGRLYTLLVAPAQELVASYVRWILVPHGPLHYLPFHALHDGRGYLIEAHEISALPGAGLLAHCRRPRPGGAGLLALGYSCDGRLPHAVEEALQVAATYGGEACVEEDATAGRIRSGAAGRRILHLATHGDFRADNPLFSGVALADGWLTTLDCFGLRLDASLVTLSGCQTGMSVIGGGDELLGLTRALLAAGAASLVLSLWAVEDASTARLMAAMYANLAAGCTKGEALRRAQLGFINGGGAAGAPEAARLAHPYTWAPFMLMGDAGAL